MWNHGYAANCGMAAPCWNMRGIDTTLSAQPSPAQTSPTQPNKQWQAGYDMESGQEPHLVRPVPIPSPACFFAHAPIMLPTNRTTPPNVTYSNLY